MRSLNINLERDYIFKRIRKRSDITHKWVVCKTGKRI